MIPCRRHPVLCFPIAVLFFVALGSLSQNSSPSTQVANAPNAEAIAAQLRSIAARGTLADLKWPKLSGLS